MAKTSKPTLPILTASMLLVLALAGCAPAATTSGGASGNPAPAAKSSASPAHSQGKLKGVPTDCPAISTVSAAVKVAFHGVSPSPVNGALVCEYYVSGAKGSPVVSMNFEPFGQGTAAQWQAATMKAQPAAKPVSGTGDAAVFFTTAKFSEFAFISGSTVCNVTASPQFTEANLANLADFVLDH